MRSVSGHDAIKTPSFKFLLEKMGFFHAYSIICNIVAKIRADTPHHTTLISRLYAGAVCLVRHA